MKCVALVLPFFPFNVLFITPNRRAECADRNKMPQKAAKVINEKQTNRQTPNRTNTRIIKQIFVATNKTNKKRLTTCEISFIVVIFLLFCNVLYLFKIYVWKMKEKIIYLWMISKRLKFTSWNLEISFYTFPHSHVSFRFPSL